MQERRPYGMGRSRGIFAKSIEKKGALLKFLRNGQPNIEKEAEG